MAEETQTYLTPEEQLSTLNFGEMLDEEVKKLRKKG